MSVGLTIHASRNKCFAHRSAAEIPPRTARMGGGREHGVHGDPLTVLDSRLTPHEIKVSHREHGVHGDPLTTHSSQFTTHTSAPLSTSNFHNSQPKHLHPLLKNNIHRNPLLFQPVQICLQLRSDYRLILDQCRHTIIVSISLEGEYPFR